MEDSVNLSRIESDSSDWLPDKVAENSGPSTRHRKVVSELDSAAVSEIVAGPNRRLAATPPRATWRRLPCFPDEFARELAASSATHTTGVGSNS